MGAVEAPNRKDYLHRLIAGLEQTIENMRFEIPYYKPDDIQLKYAKKFLASAEENLAEAQKELASLDAQEKKQSGA
jgi:hypothetical protein